MRETLDDTKLHAGNDTNEDFVGWKKNITKFLTAQTISLFGTSIVQYAIIWYITLATSSGTMMMISTVCAFLPQIVVSLFAGVWIDRYNRKKLIILSDSVIALATLLLAVLFLCGLKSIWLIYAVLIVRSAGTGIQIPAVNAILPQIVPKNNLLKINGINSTLTGIIMFLSPAISGAMMSVMPVEGTFFVDVITAFIGVGITAGILIKPHKPEFIQGNSHFAELQAGFAYIKKNPFIKHLLIFQTVILVLISPSAFLTPLMVTRSFGSEVWRLSVSEMIFSLGAILGGFLITAWGGFKKRIYTVILSSLLYGLLMIAMGLSSVFYGFLLFNLLIGVTMPCYSAPVTSLIQEEVSSSMQGRVFGFMHISTSVALPLGMVIFGPIADILKVQVILIFTGILVLIGSVLMFVKKQKI